MALFYSGDPISLACSNIAAAKQFWIEIFGCSEDKGASYWDDALPSDIALKLPGEDDAVLGLFDKAEAEQAGLGRASARALIFCSDIAKAHSYLAVRGLQPGEIGALGGMQFFEIQDWEGNTVEICMEE